MIIEEKFQCKKTQGKNSQPPILVIKLGGSLLETMGLKDTVETLKSLQVNGYFPVIVHGGGKHISKRLNALGMETAFVDGYRVTDEKAMKEVEMVLTGQVNQTLVLAFNNMGLAAVGLSGKDAGLLEAQRKVTQMGTSLGQVGQVYKVNPRIIHHLLEGGYIPLISSVGFDLSGQTYNINADDVAGAIAGGLRAEKLIMVTDVDGLLKTVDNGQSLIDHMDLEEVDRMIQSGVLTGGMIPKIKSCVKAIHAGIKSVHIINGHRIHDLPDLMKGQISMGTTIMEGETCITNIL